MANRYLDVTLMPAERISGRLRRRGPLLPWRVCNERGCWNPRSGGEHLGGGFADKCDLCIERITCQESRP